MLKKIPLKPLVLAIIVTIVSIICIIAGAVIFRHTKYTNATVTNATCTPIIGGKITQYSCKLDITYGNSYQGSTTSYSPTEYKTGDQILIEYDPTYPTNPHPKTFDKRIIGYILIIGAILLLIGFWGNFVYRYRSQSKT